MSVELRLTDMQTGSIQRSFVNCTNVSQWPRQRQSAASKGAVAKRTCHCLRRTSRHSSRTAPGPVPKAASHLYEKTIRRSGISSLRPARVGQASDMVAIHAIHRGHGGLRAASAARPITDSRPFIWLIALNKCSRPARDLHSSASLSRCIRRGAMTQTPITPAFAGPQSAKGLAASG